MVDAVLAERLRSWVMVAPDGCWLWMGWGDRAGYGQAHVGGKTRRAHRAMYEAVRGPIPEGLQLDHLCRQPACVRPDHLEAVTARENTMRGFGPTSRHARATHCGKGHPLSGDNLFISQTKKGPFRVCRTCHRARSRNWWRQAYGSEALNKEAK